MKRIPDERRPRATATPMRLQKLLADAGLGSRREIEGWISAGRVTVNGKPARLGEQASSQDRIRVDGHEVRLHQAAVPQMQIIAYHKPEGEVVTRRDPEERPTVFRRLPKPKSGRWIAVGRLDINTSGLLLFTTNGELANRLMRPATGIEREYAVRVLGALPPDAIQRLTEGILLDDGMAKLESVVDQGGSGANHWFHVVLREGRNREVRRLWEAAGCRVSRLIRVRYGNIALGRRHFAGNWRALTPEEESGLLALAGMARPSRPSGGPRRPVGPAARAPGAGSAPSWQRKRRLP